MPPHLRIHHGCPDAVDIAVLTAVLAVLANAVAQQSAPKTTVRRAHWDRAWNRYVPATSWRTAP
ncbi:acyl-CoA carboxylase subunit epsilon [Streptomyces sp. NPDC050485]|uniref:acyl-CoA carboxylase subunit epsilon n=1 Tax=Streptomyces sp. NPDC050485 TaxID=3365617 RepID=UPI00378C88D4